MSETELRYHEHRLEALRILGGACLECGERDPEVLEFDHVDPADKHFALSAGFGKKDQTEVIAELEKCQLLCCNCHARKTKRARRSARRPSAVDPSNELRMTCRACGKEFVHFRVKAFCTPGCRPTTLGEPAELVPLQENEKRCERCGVTFSTARGDRAYCAERCRKAAERLRWGRRQRNKRLESRG